MGRYEHPMEEEEPEDVNHLPLGLRFPRSKPKHQCVHFLKHQEAYLVVLVQAQSLVVLPRCASCGLQTTLVFLGITGSAARASSTGSLV